MHCTDMEQEDEGGGDGVIFEITDFTNATQWERYEVYSLPIATQTWRYGMD